MAQSLEDFLKGGSTPSTLEDFLHTSGVTQGDPNERRSKLFTQSLANVLTFPNVGGPSTPEEYASDYAANMERPDLMGLSAKAGVPMTEMAKPFSKETIRQDLAVPEAGSFGQKVEDFLVKALPYVGAGIATSPIASAGEASAAAAGKGLLGQIFRGQVQQEAAFVPGTLASSDSLGEAALTTAGGVGLGSLLGRLFAGLHPKVDAPAPKMGMDEEGLLGALVKGSKEEASRPKLSQTYKAPDIAAIDAKETADLMAKLGVPAKQAAPPAQIPMSGMEEEGLLGQLVKGAKEPVAPPQAPLSSVYKAPDLAALEAQEAAELQAKYGIAKQTAPPLPRPVPIDMEPKPRSVEEIASVATHDVNPDPALVESIRADGITEPLQIGVNPETGARILFEGKHRLAAAKQLGLPEVPSVEVPIGAGMEAALKAEGVAARAEQEAARQILEPGVPAELPIEEMTRLAPAKVNGKLVTAGSPEGLALKDEARSTVRKIVASQQAAEDAAAKKWPGWTPEKEQMFSSLTEKGVSEAQAKRLMMDPAMASRLAQNLRESGSKDLADALESVVGRSDAPPVVTLQDMISELGPEAARAYSEIAESLPEAAAKRFVENAEAGFIRMGKPMGLRNFIDRLHFFRRGALVSGTKTMLGNITGNLIGVTTAVPRNLLAAPISKLGRKLLGRGPERYAGEAAYNILGYSQSLGNAIRRLRGLEPAGMIGPATRRYSELSRTIRQQIEGSDPFSEAGAIGQSVALAPRLAFKGLGIVDQAFWDLGFHGNMMAWAYRTARQSGAKDVPAAMKKLLAEVEKDSLAAEAKAAIQTKALTPKLAAEQARGQARTMISAAEKLLGKARKSGVRVSQAEAAYKQAIKSADDLVRRTKDLTDAEKEFVQRGVMKELMPASLEESQFLTERALFMAREGKLMDEVVAGMQTVPVVRDIVSTGLPFLRTPANMAREGLRTSPLGFITAPIKLAQAGGFAELKASGVPYAEAFKQALKNADDAGLTRMYDDLAQATYGTMLAGGTIGLLSTGVIRVEQFDKNMKKEERLALEAQGIPTDSLVVGNFSVPLYRLAPIDRTIRSAAKFFDLYKQDPNAATSAADALYNEFVVSMTDDVWLSGMQELLSAASDENKAAAVASKLGGSFVPRIVQDVVTTAKGERTKAPQEPVFGSTLLGSFVGGAVKGLGGGQKDLGLFGHPREVAPLFGLTGVATRKDDPLLQELTHVGYFPTTKLPQVDLSKGESQDATQAKGFAQEQALKALIASPQYQELPTIELKRKVMEQVVGRVGDQANDLIRARKARGMSLSYSDLLQALVGK